MTRNPGEPSPGRAERRKPPGEDMTRPLTRLGSPVITHLEAKDLLHSGLLIRIVIG